MSHLERYEIKKEKSGTWAIFIKFTGDIFQDCFDSRQDAVEFLNETFG